MSETLKKNNVSASLHEGTNSDQVSLRKSRKILNLKDIFEAESNGENKEDDDPDTKKWKEEIAGIRKKKDAYEKSTVAAIIASLTLELSEEQKKKIGEVVSSRIKNIRDAVDTRLALGRAEDEGGIGLKGSDASEVSVIIEKYLKEHTKVTKESQDNHKDDSPSEHIPSLTLDLSKEGVQKKSPQEEIKEMLIEEKESPISPIATEATEVIKEKPEIQPVTIPVTKEKISIPKASTHEEVVPTPVPTARPSQAPLVEKSEKEITFGIEEKREAGLVGPIEELQQITIEDWRKLYPTVEEAITKTKDNIRVLKDNSFKEMIKGIEAWKRGSIMQLYMQIGEESASDNVDITDTAKSRQAINKSYLTQEEFHAIMDLNKDLRSYSF